MSVKLHRFSSVKSKRSSVELNRIKIANEKSGDEINVNDAYTTFKYKREASGDSGEAGTVFIFPRNWPEWSDIELNAEAWINEDEEDKQKSNQHDYYYDPEGVLLPHTQMRILDCWKRTADAFQSPCILYDDTVNAIDIISPNKHLLNSRCMRWVISSIAMVQKLAEDSPFPIEGENPQYTPNGGALWRPWHHIYSNCKAGNIPHRPLMNPSGKYIVRLYYLGCWRKIVVDDNLPFDSKGNMLLPASTVKGELWPMLLSKALLKIASHTWNKIEDTNGFHPITSLTGWICEEFINIDFDKFKLWQLISGTLEEKEEEVAVEQPSQTENPPLTSSKKIMNKTEKSPKKKLKSLEDKAEVTKLAGRQQKPTEMLAILSYWSEVECSNKPKST
ncbi:androglobin-like [Hetaerina americana]|uniref:androglobin-like n=1 Tax=Hetaerina americana TaxID=62018 RepID=UPI003A7F38FE